MANLQGRSSASFGQMTSLTGSRGAAEFDRPPKGHVQVFNKVLFLIDLANSDNGRLQEVRETVGSVVSGLDQISQLCSTQWTFRFINSRFTGAMGPDGPFGKAVKHMKKDMQDALLVHGFDVYGMGLPCHQAEQKIRYSSTNGVGGHCNSLWAIFCSALDALSDHYIAPAAKLKSSDTTPCKALMAALFDALTMLQKDSGEPQICGEAEMVSDKKGAFAHCAASPGISGCQEGPHPQVRSLVPRTGELIVVMAAKPDGEAVSSFINQSSCIEPVSKLRNELGIKVAWVECRRPLSTAQNPPADPELEDSLKRAISPVFCSKGTIAKSHILKRRNGQAWLLLSGPGDKSRYVEALTDKVPRGLKDARRPAITKTLSVREGVLPPQPPTGDQLSNTMFKGLCEGVDDTDNRLVNSGRPGGRLGAGSQDTRPSSADVSGRVDGGGLLRQRLPQQQRAQELQRAKKSRGGRSGEVRSAATDAKLVQSAKNKTMASRGNRIVSFLAHKSHEPNNEPSAAHPTTLPVTANATKDVPRLPDDCTLAGAPGPGEPPVVLPVLTPPSHLKYGAEAVAQKAITSTQALHATAGLLSDSELSVKIKDIIWEAVRKLDQIKQTGAPDSGPRGVLRDSLLRPVEDIRSAAMESSTSVNLFSTKLEVLLRLHILAVAIPGSVTIPAPDDSKKPKKNILVNEVKDLLNIYQMLAMGQESSNPTSMRDFYADVLLKDFGVPLKKTIAFLADKFDFEDKSLSPFNHEAIACDAAAASKPADQMQERTEIAAVPSEPGAGTVRPTGGCALAKAPARPEYVERRVHGARGVKGGVSKHRPNGGRQGVSKASNTKQRPNSLKSLSRNLFASSPRKEGKAAANNSGGRGIVKARRATEVTKKITHDPEGDRIVLGTPPLLGRAGRAVNNSITVGNDGSNSQRQGAISTCTSDSEVVPDTLVKPKGEGACSKLQARDVAHSLAMCLNEVADKPRLTRQPSKAGGWMIPASQQAPPAAGAHRERTAEDFLGEAKGQIAAGALAVNNESASPSSSEDSPLQMRLLNADGDAHAISFAPNVAIPFATATGPMATRETEPTADSPAVAPGDAIAQAHLSVEAARTPSDGLEGLEAGDPRSVHLAVHRLTAKQRGRQGACAQGSEEGGITRAECMECTSGKETNCRKCSGCHGMLCHKHYRKALAQQKAEPQWKTRQPFLCLQCSVPGSACPAVQAGLADATPSSQQPATRQVVVNRVQVPPVYRKTEGLLTDLFGPTTRRSKRKDAELTKTLQADMPLDTAASAITRELQESQQPADDALLTAEVATTTAAEITPSDSVPQSVPPESSVEPNLQAAVQPRTATRGPSGPTEALPQIPFAVFRVARAHARQCGFTSKRDFQRAAAGEYWPVDMPSQPQKVYEGQGWKSWDDFLKVRPAKAAVGRRVVSVSRAVAQAVPRPEAQPEAQRPSEAPALAKPTGVISASEAQDLSTQAEALPRPSTTVSTAEEGHRAPASAQGPPLQSTTAADALPNTQTEARPLRSSARLSSARRLPVPAAEFTPTPMEEALSLRTAGMSTSRDNVSPRPQLEPPLASQGLPRLPTKPEVEAQPVRVSARLSSGRPAPQSQVESTPAPVVEAPPRRSTRVSTSRADYSKYSAAQPTLEPSSAPEMLSPTNEAQTEAATQPLRVSARLSAGKPLPESTPAQAEGIAPSQARPTRMTRTSGLAKQTPDYGAETAKMSAVCTSLAQAPEPREVLPLSWSQRRKRSSRTLRGSSGFPHKIQKPSAKSAQAAETDLQRRTGSRGCTTRSGRAPATSSEPAQEGPSFPVPLDAQVPITRTSARLAACAGDVSGVANESTFKQPRPAPVSQLRGPRAEPARPAQRPTTAPLQAPTSAATRSKTLGRASAVAANGEASPVQSEREVAPTRHSLRLSEKQRTGPPAFGSAPVASAAQLPHGLRQLGSSLPGSSACAFATDEPEVTSSRPCPSDSEGSDLSADADCEDTAAAVAEMMCHETGPSPSHSSSRQDAPRADDVATTPQSHSGPNTRCKRRRMPSPAPNTSPSRKRRIQSAVAKGSAGGQLVTPSHSGLLHRTRPKRNLETLMAEADPQPIHRTTRRAAENSRPLAAAIAWRNDGAKLEESGQRGSTRSRRPHQLPSTESAVTTLPGDAVPPSEAAVRKSRMLYANGDLGSVKRPCSSNPEGLPRDSEADRGPSTPSPFPSEVDTLVAHQWDQVLARYLAFARSGGGGNTNELLPLAVTTRGISSTGADNSIESPTAFPIKYCDRPSSLSPRQSCLRQSSLTGRCAVPAAVPSQSVDTDRSSGQPLLGKVLGLIAWPIRQWTSLSPVSPALPVATPVSSLAAAGVDDEQCANRS